ncbi:RING finger protein 121 [Nematocida displodere]|uniref:RING finger protein 121 n=1 Tax=Nematocida displodere TaxID=1805483 RepID=A0A177EI35_9MICR|nr:RING finger protein 121 [Nematocida displodere]
MDHSGENGVDNQERTIVLSNVRKITRHSNVQKTEDGVLVQEILVVEVDGGEGNLLNSLMALCIVFVGVQICAFLWKRVHKKSFSVLSTLILLFFPLVTAVLSLSWVFVGAWAVVALGHMAAFGDIFLGRRPRMLTTNVYAIYRKIFRVSLALSGVGYFMVAYGFFRGVAMLYRKGVFLLMYVLYYTLVVRIGLDFVSYKASGTILPSKTAKKEGICPMCGEGEKAGNKMVHLSCKETIHEECLKNWKILGKKDTCPSCKEKVDLSFIPMNPWQRNEYVFTQFLDFASNLILAYAATQGVVFFLNI